MPASWIARSARFVLFAMVAALVIATPGIASAEEVQQPPAADGPDAPPAVADAETDAWVEPQGTTTTMADLHRIIGADAAHHRGITGEGVGVALIDTGVAPVEGLTDVVHGPDLSFESNIEAAYQLDAYGHGTHLAGIITSDRADARGVAPDATLLSIKTGAHNGAVDVTQVIAAIDWVVQHKDEIGIRVLVLAYGTDGRQDPRHDPLTHAVQTAWHNGITVIVAAGNDGEHAPEVLTPATDPYVITVGATDTRGTVGLRDDTVASFSPVGTAAREPDLVAPGVGVVANGVPGGFLSQSYPEAVWPGGLMRGSGTSQAAAVVGGAAALLLQQRPELTPDEVKAVLTHGARNRAQPLVGSGHGLLDVMRSGRAEAPRSATQSHPVSIGDGTLDGSRGSHVVTFDDVPLLGDMDIHGQPVDTAAWAAAATAGTSWADGWWNGTAWTGTTGFTGLSWGGLSWGGLSWGGLSWGGLSWGGLSWGGLSWGGLSWGGGSWGGLSWGGLSWGGLSWGGLSWGGLSWGGLSWGGLSWGGLSWGSIRWI